MKINIIAVALVLSFCVTSPAADVTLTVNNNASLGVIKTSDSVTIGTNETATVVGVFYYGTDGMLEIVKNGITNNCTVASLHPPSRSTVVPGPAIIRLNGTANPVFVTLRVAPESFPPDKTIIIPQGTPGANIIMEQSTDLINWTNSVPGTYTNTAVNHLFFRLRAERL